MSSLKSNGSIFKILPLYIEQFRLLIAGILLMLLCVLLVIRRKRTNE